MNLEFYYLIYRIKRQIHKPFFFFVVCHRGADRNFRCKFFVICFQTFCSEIYFCLYFNRYNSLARINDKVNFAGASVIGVVIYIQILNRFQLLTNILLRKGAFKLNKKVIAVK